MASLYVYALTDAAIPARADDGRAIEAIPVGRIFAVCEHRRAAPAVSEAELRRQHEIVLRIAESAPAVLPARFGSLVDDAELARILQDRADVVLTALDRVRGHVQMTVRIAGSAALQGCPSTNSSAALQGCPSTSSSAALQGCPSTNSSAALQGCPSTNSSAALQGCPSTNSSAALQGCPSTNSSAALQSCPPSGSGRAYLQERFRQAIPEIPQRARVPLNAVKKWVADERRTARGTGVITLYHLVRRADVQKYKDALAHAHVAGMRVSGPWPAFAFAPDLWT